MSRKENARETVLKASRAYYGHVAYYGDLLAQRNRRATEARKRELDFLEFAFRTHSTHRVRDVLDVACGNGPHVVGLAHRGYQCTGQDYTPERVQIAKAKAKREGISVKLLQGDATKLKYKNEFDAALALYILFLLPNDDDVLKCLQQINKALKPGGILICNIGNPFSDSKAWFSLKTIHQGGHTQETHVRGMRYTEIDRVQNFDPLHGVVWWQETSIIEAPDGTHIFRDRERTRLFTYWDILHYLQAAGFKEIRCYPDWKTKPPKKPKAETLVFVSRKD
jgi:SAM-dependent methyltransferase